MKTEAQRPYREELLSKMESDGDKIVKEIIFGPGQKKYRFCKHMASQCLPGLSDELMKRGKHLILIRKPFDLLRSYDEVAPPSEDDLGYASMLSIYRELKSLGKPLPPIIDSDLLREDPEGTLRGLCDDLDIPFQEAMLKWESGPRPFDGMWAPYRYKTAHQSTGFEPRRKCYTPFPSSLYELLEDSRLFYDLLTRQVKPTTKRSLQPSLPFPANKKLHAWVGDEIVPRKSAKCLTQLCKEVTEFGKVFVFIKGRFLNLRSIWTGEGSHFQTLTANGMFDNAHIRLTLTRGEKVTSGMSPTFNLYGCTLIVLAEWKPPVYDNAKGITLAEASTRRNPPESLDSKIHHNNLLNNILAKLEGDEKQADDAIMLDRNGFVSETNATNIFMVKKGRVATPTADYCLPGITRAAVMDLVVKENLVLEVRNISMSEFQTADEVFTTGTMGELTPVVRIDGITIGEGRVGPVTQRLQNAYKKVTEDSGVPIPINAECS